MTKSCVRVGFYGFGKRARNIYLPLIRKFEDLYFVSGFFRRNKEQGLKDSVDFNLTYFSSKVDLTSNCDIIVVSVPEAAQEECLTNLSDFKGTILLETPVSSQRVVELSKNLKIGVIEQWVYTPVEQFKSMLYCKSIIERPRVVQNNFRSYDYHAIAQMREYLDNKSPIAVSSFMTSIQIPSHINNSGNLQTSHTETFDMSTIQMLDGSLIQHNFSYDHKTSPLRGIQCINCISSNGSILTGKIVDKTNDCEIFDVRSLRGNEVKNHNVIIERSGETTVSISIEDLDITWQTPKLGLDDQEIAISKVLENCTKGILYSPYNAFIDSMIMRAIKISGHNREIVRFQ